MWMLRRERSHSKLLACLTEMQHVRYAARADGHQPVKMSVGHRMPTSIRQGCSKECQSRALTAGRGAPVSLTHTPVLAVLQPPAAISAAPQHSNSEATQRVQPSDWLHTHKMQSMQTRRAHAALQQTPKQRWSKAAAIRMDLQSRIVVLDVLHTRNYSCRRLCQTFSCTRKYRRILAAALCAGCLLQGANAKS